MPNEASAVDALAAHFDETIAEMDVRFTSHQFLLRLAHDHQREYVAGLVEHAADGKPFRDLHHALIKRLKQLDGKQIALSKQSYPSQDIFGTPSHAGLWRKL